MKKSAKIAIISITVILAIIAISIGGFFLLIEPNANILNAPELDESLLTSYSRTVKILNKDGNPIDDALYDNNKIYVRRDDLQDYTVNAFVAIEDKRFYKHKGVDYKRVVAAAVSNIKSRKFGEGASTITQQLIKNTHLSNEKTIRRKLNEMRLARKLERVYSKDQILESYFNILYFGSGIHGLGTASRVMFDKPASELTLAQSAALASIINNPSKYSPYRNSDNLNERKETVLRRMLEQGFISQDEYKSACAEKIVFNKNFKTQFISGLLRAAANRYNCSEKELFAKNYTFETAYDPKIVSAAREAINSMTDFNHCIRVLVLDNATGGIACDETNTDGYINPKRSPASTVKPFISYAPALESGLTPLSQILDEPADFDGYAPKNYKNIYRGYQSLKDCLKYSSNIAAVKLLNDTGIDAAKSTAARFGLTFEDSDSSLALALGGMEKGLTLSELANAYRTLANGGRYSTARYILNDGALSITSQAVSDDTAYLLTDMLKECAKSGTAKKLKYSGIIAAKTGTNGNENGNTDCYCIAYTPLNTIAVWFGSLSSNELIDNKITGAACCNIIKKICNSGAIETDNDFVMPQSVAYYEVDGKALQTEHEVYLADPLLPKRYRIRALLSKRNLPVRKNIDFIDFFDRLYWDDKNIFGSITDNFKSEYDCFDIG